MDLYISIEELLDQSDAQRSLRTANVVRSNCVIAFCSFDSLPSTCQLGSLLLAQPMLRDRQEVTNQ